MEVQVFLLGNPRVLLDHTEVIFPYRKVEGLFYYLCIKGVVSRDEAIGIFWADCTEGSARKNLRDALYHLKKLFGEELISTEGNNRITLKKECIASIDYDQVTEENIFQRYTGDFLGYFYIKNCIEFENWATGIREDLLRQYRKAANSRVNAVSQGDDLAAMEDCAVALLGKSILEEELFQTLLSGMLRLGGVAEAERTYQKLRKALASELEVEPEERTEEIMAEAAQLRRCGAPKPSGQKPAEYFFGREQEMLLLLSSIQRFRQGKGSSSILLSGEAGIGKSAIMNHLQASLDSELFIPIYYQCVQTEEELYLKPWNDVLSQAEKLCKEHRIPYTPAPDFYSHQQVDVSVFSTQYELFVENIFQTLSDALPEKKVILFIDDIQWMDAASRRLLSNLLFWSRQQKVMAVLTSRSDSSSNLTALKAPLLANGLLQEVVISRFTEQEIKKLIQERKPELLSIPGALERICHNTDGNALFLFEYLKELEHGGEWNQLSPKTTGMIQSRLMNLTPEERTLLEHISLYPRFATMEELQALTTDSTIQILKSLESLLSKQLICVRSTYNFTGYGFSHQLIRDYVYNSLLKDKRILLHRMAAEACEEKFLRTGDINLCPMLINHFQQCNDICKAYTYRLEYLKAFYAVQHEIYPTALTNSSAESEHSLPRLAAADELVSLADQIRSLSKNSSEMEPLRMKLEFLIGRYDLYSGNYEVGLKNIQTSIALAEKLHDWQYELENHLQLIFHAIQIDDLKMYYQNLLVCEQLVKEHEYSEADNCTVMRLRGLFCMKSSQYAQAESVLQQVIRRMEALCKTNSDYRMGLAACYNYLGESRQARKLWKEALEYYQKAIQCCNNEMVSGVAVFQANAGYALLQLGLLDEAQEHIDKANRCFETLGAMWGRSRAQSYAALLAMKKGDWDEAKRRYELAKQSSQKGGNPASIILVSQVGDQLQAHENAG